MQPTFNPGHASAPLHHDVVLLDRWSVALNLYKRGDVVTLWSPQNPKLLTTKRIIALEGDLVSMRGRRRVSSSHDQLNVSHECVLGPPAAPLPAYTCTDTSRSLLGRRRLALPLSG